MHFRTLLVFSLLAVASGAAVSTKTVTKTKTATKTTTKTSTKTTTKTSTHTSTVSVCPVTDIDNSFGATTSSRSTTRNMAPTAPPTNSFSSSRTSTTTPVPTAPPTNSGSSSVSTTTTLRSTSSSTSKTTSRTTSTVTMLKPTATGTRSGKIALAWANQERDAISNFVNKNVAMVYTWSPYCPPQAASLNLLCCPMLWGPKKLAQFQQIVVPGYSTCVMGFNEPMVTGQSNMTPSAAADLWMSAIHPLTTQGYTTVVSPAILTSTSGLNWMASFVKLCPQCYKDIDIIAVHTYNINATKAIANYNAIHNLYPGKKIAITEFACQSYYSGDPYENCTVDQAKAFMLAIMSFVENTSWMEWAAYFGMFKEAEIGSTGVYKSNAMIGSDNMPNALGKAYLSS